MTMNSGDVIVSGVHLDLTKALKETVFEKVEKLFRHEHHIIRVRVELQYNANNSKQNEFVAKGHIELTGSDKVASAGTGDLYKSIDLLVEKLDRMLRRRSRMRKTKRNHPHDVEIPSEIPKVQAG